MSCLIERKIENMNIEFLNPPVPDENFGIIVRAKVDDQTIICHFAQEALQDVNPSMRMLSPMQMYKANEPELRAITERLIRNGKIQRGYIYIRTNDVRS